MKKTSPSILSELELDALTELVNLGISQAALSLARMVQEEVVLSVPKVTLVDQDEALRAFGGGGLKKLVAVHQVFEGDFTGRALLIFPEVKSLELVKAVIGRELSIEEIIELEEEALAETGNIILNGCLATMANTLRKTLKISLPEVLRGEIVDFFSLKPPPESGDTVMLIYINFAVRRRNVEGYIAMLMDMPSLTVLKALLGEFIRETGASTE